MESEFFPVAAGVLIGLILGGITARKRPWAWLALSVLFGVAATVLSGEYKVSWEYLLVDIPLVGGASAVAFVASRAFVGSRARGA
jgi:hypothetical protein